MLIEDILTARGYAVTVANNRAQLDEALQLDCWTLAITDTGFATFEEMQRWNVDRIILCTGMPKADLADMFPHMPYIEKPCSAADFDAVLGGAEQPTCDHSSSGAVA